jgi:hypothetical protein
VVDIDPFDPAANPVSTGMVRITGPSLSRRKASSGTASSPSASTSSSSSGETSSTSARPVGMT